MSTKKAHRLKRIATNSSGSFYSLPLLYSTAVQFFLQSPVYSSKQPAFS